MSQLHPPLLAFGFLNNTLLWGAILAGIPILIHLLSKRRYRRLRWAAQEWLLAALKKSARRIKLEQLLLLALRTLLILFVVIAIARPYSERPALAVLAPRRTHRVVVLDASLSMGVSLGGVSRFERAVELAGAIARMSRRGDGLSIILAQRPARVVIPGPDVQTEAALAELAALRVTHGQADLAGALNLAAQLFASSRNPNRELYILTDLQRSTWTAQEIAPSILAELGPETAVIVVDVGGEVEVPNIAILDLRLDDRLAVTARPASVTARLRNLGSKPFQGYGVTLIVNGRSVARRVVDLDPGATVEVNFEATFTEPGFQRLKVAGDEDVLPLDNSRWLSVPARERVRVLCIDGEPMSEPFASECDYLALALSPTAELDPQLSPFLAEVRPEADLIDLDLSPYDLVVLANVGQLTESEASKLRAYVRAGGNLLVTLGSQVNADNYNEVLFSGDDPLLPVVLGPKVGDPVEKTSVFRLDPLEYRHPIVKPFEGAPAATLLSTMTYAYQKVRVGEEKGHDVNWVLAFDSGDPAVLVGKYGEGDVGLWTTSIDDDWTTWPVWPSYVPVIQELVRYLVATDVGRWNLQVGEVVSIPSVAGLLDLPVTVAAPGRQTVERLWDAARGPFHFDGTQVGGFVEVTVGPPVAQTYVFALNPPVEESDLTRLDSAEINRLLPGMNVRYVRDVDVSVGDDSPQARARTGELHRPFLYAALVILVLESLLACRLGQPR